MNTIYLVRIEMADTNKDKWYKKLQGQELICTIGSCATWDEEAQKPYSTFVFTPINNKTCIIHLTDVKVLKEGINLLDKGGEV